MEVLGLPDVPDGSYLVDDQGRVAFGIEPGIGSKAAPGPQARLMSLVIRGILTRKLPWGLVLLGVFTSVVMEIVGVPALSFAVGVYLPLESTTPIFVGGLVRRLIDLRRGTESESDAGPGVLFSSGLIAGGSLMGLAYAFLQFDAKRIQDLRDHLAIGNQLLPKAFLDSPIPGALTFLVLAFLLYRVAGEKPEAA
jgi:hypothetical protein